MSEIIVKNRGTTTTTLESNGWGGAFSGGLPSSSREALEGIMEMMEDGDKASSSQEFKELGEAIKELFIRVKKKGHHAMTKKQVMVWILCEILDTDVSPEELGTWIKHKPTIDEIVFGDEPSSIISLLSSPDGKAAEQRFKLLVSELF